MTSEARACSRRKGSKRPEARFCDGCGAPVARAAGDPRPVREYTPRHLVDKVLATRSSLEGERKQARYCLAQAQLAAGSFEDAAHSASEGLVLVREHDTARENEVALLAYRAHALSALGDPAAAAPLAREALRLYRAMGAEGHAARLAETRGAP